MSDVAPFTCVPLGGSLTLTGRCLAYLCVSTGYWFSSVRPDSRATAFWASALGLKKRWLLVAAEVEGSPVFLVRTRRSYLGLRKT